jgi:hypothetical protein
MESDFMPDEAYRKINGKYEECIVWELDEFEKLIDDFDWSRREVKEDFLKKMGISSSITPPDNTMIITVSGTNSVHEAPEDKEVLGMDSHRNDPSDDETYKAYHRPFYRRGDEIIMPIEHKKRPIEERLHDNLEEFDKIHDESKNYNLEEQDDD